jgi:glycosyltransferase involved in cell wall biosynthesis
VSGLVTVAIPVLNEEAHIGDQLAALAGQTYRAVGRARISIRKPLRL